MSSDDYGKDLAAIQALQRKQEDVEKDMTAIHLQIQVLVPLIIYCHLKVELKAETFVYLRTSEIK